MQYHARVGYSRVGRDGRERIGQRRLNSVTPERGARGSPRRTPAGRPRRDGARADGGFCGTREGTSRQCGYLGRPEVTCTALAGRTGLAKMLQKRAHLRLSGSSRRAAASASTPEPRKAGPLPNANHGTAFARRWRGVRSAWSAARRQRPDGQRPNDPQPSDMRVRALIALLATIALIVGGMFLTHELRRAADLQDCVMSGRTNCAPISPP